MAQEQSAGNREKVGATEKSKLKYYIQVAGIVFLTFCCCILFFFMIYRFRVVLDYAKRIGTIFQPITIGVVLAYLLNPIMKFQERYLLKWFLPKTKNTKKIRSIARGISISGSLVFFLGSCVLFISIVVPAIMNTVQRTVSELAAGDEVDKLLAWADEFIKADTQLAQLSRQLIEQASAWLQDVLEDFLYYVRAYMTSIISGVIYGVKLLINIIVGIVISVYILINKEKFAAQTKKIIYALFNPTCANEIVETVRKSHEIFGGFISGKILDSAIIGVLAYVSLLIMKMPDALLLSVIIGVTNVIPVFGPFFGAVPCFIIVVLQNPWQGLYLLIFILILQQIDGNIIGPKILGDSIGLSSFWVLFAILVFGGLWGFAGMLLGVPIMAVIYYQVNRIVNHFLKKRGLSRETNQYLDLERVDKHTNRMVYEDSVKKEACLGDEKSACNMEK